MKQIHPARRIIPQLLTWITGRQRYLPDLEWGTAVLTGNLFRAFEWLCWRAYGKNGPGDTIRAESAVQADMVDGVLYVTRQFFTLEAAVAHAETVVRAYLGKAFEPRPELGFMPQPVFLTLGILGLKLSLQGDLHGILAPIIGMAVATDTTATGTISSNAVLTVGITVTSTSDRAVWAGFIANKVGIPALSSVTFAGSAMSASVNSPKSLPSDTTVKPFLNYKLAAPSGANNCVITFASAPDAISANVVSYSGVGSVPQDTSTNGTGGTTTLTLTTTIDNSWIVGIQRDNSSGDGSAGSGTTKRSFVAGQCGFYDTGGAKTPVGSYSINATHGSAEYAGIGMSMAPVTSTTYNQTVSATGAGVAATKKALTMSATVLHAIGAGVAVVKKGMTTAGTTLHAIGAGVGAVKKGITMSITTLHAVGAGTAVIAASRAYLKTLAAVGAGVATTSQQFIYGKILAASAVGSAALAKTLHLSKVLAATGTGVAATIVTRGILLRAIGVGQATVHATIGKTLSVVASAVALIRKDFWGVKYPERGDDYEVKYPHGR